MVPPGSSIYLPTSFFGYTFGPPAAATRLTDHQGNIRAVMVSMVARSPDFDRQVAPILAGRCLECHSGAEPKGKLDLSQAKAALAGGESGAAIEAGKPEAGQDSALQNRLNAVLRTAGIEAAPWPDQG